MMSHEQLSKLWQFVRCEPDLVGFEEWLYSDDTLEDALGESVYWDLISCRFSKEDETSKVRALVRSKLQHYNSCECFAVRNQDVVFMGGDDFYLSFFESMDVVDKAVAHKPWLKLLECRICGEHWFVVEEARWLDFWVVGRKKTTEPYPSWAGSFLSALEQGVQLSSGQSLRKIVELNMTAQSQSGFTRSQIDGYLEHLAGIVLGQDPTISADCLAKHLGITKALSTRVVSR